MVKFLISSVIIGGTYITFITDLQQFLIADEVFPCLGYRDINISIINFKFFLKEITSFYFNLGYNKLKNI